MTIFNLYALGTKFRARRIKEFCEVMGPESGTILDVGGFPEFWRNAPVSKVATLNLIAPKSDDPRITPLQGNGCSMPEFADRQFPIGFSNSVIEHVGTWENQIQFATEIRRVSRKLWVQTPAYGFPIEPHYMAPFVHWLPRNLQRRIVRYFTPWGLLSKPTKAQVDEMVDTTRILTRREVKLLFPDCEIRTERVCGLPKSYTAVRI